MRTIKVVAKSVFVADARLGLVSLEIVGRQRRHFKPDRFLPWQRRRPRENEIVVVVKTANRAADCPGLRRSAHLLSQGGGNCCRAQGCQSSSRDHSIHTCSLPISNSYRPTFGR